MLVRLIRLKGEGTPVSTVLDLILRNMVVSKSMEAKNTRWIWRVTGGLVIIFWLVMMGLLLNRYHIAPINISKIFHASLKDKEEWASIYLHNQKVGYSVTTVTKNEGGYLLGEQTFMQLKVMDQPQQVTTYTICQVDDDFLLKSFNFRLVSGLITFSAEGEVKGHKLDLTIETAGERSRKEIPVAEIPFLPSALKPFLVHRGVKVGDHYKLPLWDPATQSSHVITVDVEKKESITLNNQNFQAFCIRTDFMGMTLRSWVSQDGDLLKEEGPMGIIIIKSTKEEALSDITAESLDILSTTSIPCSPIQKPRMSKYLKVRLSGSPLTGFNLNSGRQTVKGDTLVVAQEVIKHEASYQIPNKNQLYINYLRPSLLIQSSHPEIVKAAQGIIGNERNSVKVAQLLTQWVYNHVEKKPILSIPSALEVLKHKMGDCNEHSALLTAILRAVGIPARPCVGILYSEGRFYYHAWVEAYLGDWVSIDPVLNQMPTDATHIKFIEGDLSRQVEMLRVVGKIRVEVIGIE